MHRHRAFTLIEIVVIIGTVLLLFLVLIPSVNRAKRARDQRCLNNLNHIGISFRIWSADGDMYPPKVPVENGGAQEALEAGNVFFNFLVMSNELSTPGLLVCPWDIERRPSTNFGPALTDTNLSYFVGLDAVESSPLSILSGDRNLARSGGRLGHGLFTLATNTVLTWTEEIHQAHGNLLLCDGSAQATDEAQLAATIRNQGVTTNRLAIP